MFTIKSATLVTTIAIASLAACSDTEEQANVEPTLEYQSVDVPEGAPPTTPETPAVSQLEEEVPEPVTVEGEASPPIMDMDGDYFTVTIRHGENLVALADLAKTSVDDIAELNQLDDFDSLAVGQEIYIRIPPSEGGVNSDAFMHDFDLRRMQALASRVERYQERQGGLVEMQVHRVATGDSAWALASREFDIPLWVLSHYNPDVDLERLRIGQQLTYPLLQSTVKSTDSGPSRVELVEAKVEPVEAPVAPSSTAALQGDLTIQIDPFSGETQIEYLIEDFDLNGEE